MKNLSWLRTWLRPLPHHCRRSIDLVRVVVALIIAAHPIHTLAHAADLHELVAALQARGLPAAAALTPLLLVFQLVCSLGLLIPRLIVPACLGTMAVLLGGIVMLYAPYWYVAGGHAVDGHPGAEYNVLLLVCLAGVLWTYRPVRIAGARLPDPAHAAARGLDIVRIGTACLLLGHSLAPFVVWDAAGMRAWGQGMSTLGFPSGVALVWCVVSLQTLANLALITRRLVVPACLLHFVVLGNGIWIVHAPEWFTVGPPNNGMELPVVYITCFMASLLAHWPPRKRAQALAPAVPASSVALGG